MHIKLNIVLLLLVLTLDGQGHTASIYGGHEAVPHSRPYMVLLEYSCAYTQKHCDGFLLDEDFVMTAAHCKAENYKVFLGLHNYHSEDKHFVSVDEVFPHENFFIDDQEIRNDIMLLKLSSKAVFSDKVKPIKLAGPDDHIRPQDCLVSGWGRSNRSNNHSSPKLMEVNVTLVDGQYCDITDVYCTQGETGPARGDSGGPLVCENGTAYGIVSASYGSLHVFTKISKYTSWIENIISSEICWVSFFFLL
uniref:trypsin n=1 Tax=Myripristis murdjan TaxID=586833 RepID=A0A667X9P3_9TELE